MCITKYKYHRPRYYRKIIDVFLLYSTAAAPQVAKNAMTGQTFSSEGTYHVFIKMPWPSISSNYLNIALIQAVHL